MGDMADLFLQEVEVAEEERRQYRSGNIDTLEAYELGIVDELGREYQPEEAK